MDPTQIDLATIKQSMKDGNPALAAGQLEAYLQVHHDDLGAIKLHKKIQGEIHKINIKKVKRAIKESDFMWKEKRYTDLLKLYMKLRPLTPDYDQLNNLIAKAYGAQKATSDEAAGESIGQIQEQVDTYCKAGQYQEALNFILSAIERDKSNPVLVKLLTDTKRRIINKKLKKNKARLKQSTVPEKFDFMKSLYSMEPTYDKMRKELYKAHREMKAYYENKEESFEKDAKRQIRVLFNRKQYSKAKQAVNELLRVKNRSKFARTWLVKVNDKIDNENFKAAYKKMGTVE